MKTQPARVHGHKTKRQNVVAATVLSWLRDGHTDTRPLRELHHDYNARLRAETLPNPDSGA